MILLLALLFPGATLNDTSLQSVGCAPMSMQGILLGDHREHHGVGITLRSTLRSSSGYSSAVRQGEQRYASLLERSRTRRGEEPELCASGKKGLMKLFNLVEVSTRKKLKRDEVAA